MRALALAALLLVACRPSDPCAGHSGACIGLDVETQGVAAVDQLAFSIAVAGLPSPLRAMTPPEPGPPVTLPGRTAIYLDPSVAGAATVSVDGFLRGQRVGAGSTALQLVAGGHARATVTLRAFDTDGGFVEDLLIPPIDFARPPFDLVGADLGATAACPASSTFCDNFEGETLAFEKWNGSMSGLNAQVRLDNTHPFLSGSTSLRVTSTGGMFALRKTLSPASGFLAMRFYAWISSTLVDSTTLLTVLNSNSTEAFSIAGGFDASHVENGHWKLHSTSDFYGPPMVLNQWQCVEVDVDLAASTMQLYVTDATNPDRAAPPIVSGTVPATSTPGPFYLGIYAIPPGATADLWFDDVVVASQHIGCE
jgi:hypothetical protein